MSNQVDYVNLPLPKGAEQIAAGAAQFAAALGGSAAKIGEQYAAQEKIRQKAIADAKKERDKTRASIKKENEKRRREGQSYLAEKGQDTLDYEAESKRLGELANEAEFRLTPPYSDSYSREELDEAQKQVDEFFNYINTSKAAGGKVEAAITASQEITNSGGLPDQVNGYTNNVQDLVPGGITDQESYTKNNTYNIIASSYFTEGKVLPSGWNVNASNRSEKGQSISSYTFTGPNKESFVYTIDGSNSPLEFSRLIGESTLFDGTKTIKDEKTGNIVDRFKYSSTTANIEDLGGDLQRINETQMIDMFGIQTEFKDQVRGNIQGAFLEGKLGLSNYIAYNADKEGLLQEAINIYDSDKSDREKVDRLTNLIFNPMFEEFQSKYNPREATEEEKQQAAKNGIDLIDNMVYSEVYEGKAKTKPSDGGEATAKEKQFFAASESANNLFQGKVEGNEVQIKGLQLVMKNGKVFIKDYGSYQGLSVAKDTFKTGFSSFVQLKQALPEVFGALTPAERKQLQ